MLRLFDSNVLESKADALLLTLDGQARGLRDNVAHAFQRRWPDDYAAFGSEPRFPVPLVLPRIGTRPVQFSAAYRIWAVS